MVTSLLALVMFQRFTSSVEEEEARSMGGGHVLRHVADFQVVDETPEKEQETCGGGTQLIQRWRNDANATLMVQHSPSNRKIHQSQYCPLK